MIALSILASLAAAAADSAPPTCRSIEVSPATLTRAAGSDQLRS